MENEWIKGTDKSRTRITINSVFTYNMVVCLLSQVNDLVERMENILFMVEIEDVDNDTDISCVMDYRKDIEEYISESENLLKMSDKMIETYLTHFSEENENDGDELVDRYVLLDESVKNYTAFFAKLKGLEKNKKAMNKLLDNIGGIANLN